MKVCKTCQRLYRCEDDFLQGTSRWRLAENNWLYFNCSCESTLVLPPGIHHWYNPTKFMRSEAKDVFNRLALGELVPHLPAAIYILQDKMRDPNSTPEQIGQALRSEPTIAADLLKMANAFRAGGERPIYSLKHAVVFIGRRILSNLVLTASLRQFNFATTFFTEEKYWTEAFTAALIAEKIAQPVLSPAEADQAYICACLMNIGKVVGAVCLPSEIDGIFELCVKDKITWQTAELRLRAASHETLGEIAAVLWGLPPFVWEIASRHHALNDMPTGKQSLVRDIAGLANQLSHWLLGQSYRMDEDLMLAIAKRLGHDRLSLVKLIASWQPLLDEAQELGRLAKRRKD